MKYYLTEAGAAKLARVTVAKLKKRGARRGGVSIQLAKRGEYSAAQRMRGEPNPSRKDQPKPGSAYTAGDDATQKLRAKQKGYGNLANDPWFNTMNKPVLRGDKK
tara:strand:+ start:306 stop:620 length:315 start_codon:yes stop_codon:yes gene_type:complete